MNEKLVKQVEKKVFFLSALHSSIFGWLASGLRP